ncbi:MULTISPECIES: NUDIX domain-containing protein [unclassified Inquilinus]|uniref:NUDIX domain-containing protein n=1 Tax=unclassified Inquilinus TaxID=2645927 RepID=UPI003F8DC369
MPEDSGSPKAMMDRPRIGVGAVVWRDDRLLLIQRGKAPQAGQWSIPGGSQELGETLFEAALRETLEEAGVEAEALGILTAVDSIHRDADAQVEWHYTIIDVECEWRSGEPVAGDDAAAARWATLDEADALIEWPELRRVLHLSARQRHQRQRRQGQVRLKPRPDLMRLMRTPLGRLVARPWFDGMSLALLRGWFLPASRSLAAAIAAEGDLHRFCAELEIAPEVLGKRPLWLGRTLRDISRLTEQHRQADAEWQRLLFSTTAPLADVVAAEEARLDAASALTTSRLRFALFGNNRKIPACRWAIPTVAEVDDRHGARLADSENAYRLPDLLPVIEETRRLPSELGTDHWVTFPSPEPAVASACWARVFTPADVVNPPTVVHLHGVCMEPDHLRGPLTEIESLVRRGLRVVLVEAPWHGRRKRHGSYAGEPMVASTPLGALDHLSAAVREVAILTRWARQTSTGAVGWSGISFGALTAQLAATHSGSWPAACRPDALLLFTTSEGIEDIAFGGSFARAFGLDRALAAAGWDEAALSRWRPLTDPVGRPEMDTGNVFMVLGSKDDVTPFAGGQAIARRWGVPEAQVHVRPQGHFSVPAGLMVDGAPIADFAERLLAL